MKKDDSFPEDEIIKLLEKFKIELSEKILELEKKYTELNLSTIMKIIERLEQEFQSICKKINIQMNDSHKYKLQSKLKESKEVSQIVNSEIRINQMNHNNLDFSNSYSSCADESRMSQKSTDNRLKEIIVYNQFSLVSNSYSQLKKTKKFEDRQKNDILEHQSFENYIKYRESEFKIEKSTSFAFKNLEKVKEEIKQVEEEKIIQEDNQIINNYTIILENKEHQINSIDNKNGLLDHAQENLYKNEKNLLRDTIILDKNEKKLLRDTIILDKNEEEFINIYPNEQNQLNSLSKEERNKNDYNIPNLIEDCLNFNLIVDEPEFNKPSNEMSIKEKFLNAINNYGVTDIADFYLNNRSLEEAILFYFQDRYRSDKIKVTFSFNSTEFYHEFSTMDDSSCLLLIFLDKLRFVEDYSDFEFFLEDGTHINISDENYIGKYIGSYPFPNYCVKLTVVKKG
jgi:hypothetical protein